MDSEVCDYCGSRSPRAWQGNMKWCGSDECDIRHQWAACEPKFYIYMEPTPTQRAFAWVLWLMLEPIWRMVPVKWITQGKGWRMRFAVSVYGTSYHLSEVSCGR